MGKCFVGSYPAEDFLPKNFIYLHLIPIVTSADNCRYIQALNYCHAYYIQL